MSRVTVFAGAPWALATVERAGFDEYVCITKWPDAAHAEIVPTTRYVFFLNWSERVSDALLSRYECVNFHCTPLPYGRGGHPIENMILQGHTETVITAHRMTSELDAGPIYGRYGPVSLAGTKAAIQERFVAPVALLMRGIVEMEPEPSPQEGTPTCFKRLSPVAYEAFWASRG